MDMDNTDHDVILYQCNMQMGDKRFRVETHGLTKEDGLEYGETVVYQYVNNDWKLVFSDLHYSHDNLFEEHSRIVGNWRKAYS